MCRQEARMISVTLNPRTALREVFDRQTNRFRGLMVRRSARALDQAIGPLLGRIEQRYGFQGTQELPKSFAAL